MRYVSLRDAAWMFPSALGLAAVLAWLEPGSWFLGWLEFSVLLLLCFVLLTMSTRWAGGARVLAWMVALAFGLRLATGIATYLALPVNGFADVDDKAGFVYTDAHRRDDQSWNLAQSDLPLVDAFQRSYAYDQYGGLLAFSALIYRYVTPDAHRPLTLVLLAALAGALALPFSWKAVSQQWGEAVGLASGWIFALYPESILLGGSSMREPYLILFSAFALWGFVRFGLHEAGEPPSPSRMESLFWFGLGIAGMLLVSPVVVLVTLLLFAGWLYFSTERGRLPWWVLAIVVAVFIAGLFVLSSALDRQGNLGSSPFSVINNFLRAAVKLDVHNLERSSGWVQKLFAQMPNWLRLPFVLVYGIFQPVLPAALLEPTTLTWRIIAIARALGWWVLLPALILSFGAAAGSSVGTKRWILIWLSVVVWGWILLTSLRGGADLWDNPRYRMILFLWQAILTGHVWVWWRAEHSRWVLRVLAMEAVFLAFFGEWYANRYTHFGPEIPFAQIVLAILLSWLGVIGWGIWQDRRLRAAHSV